MTRVGDEIFEIFLRAALVLAELQDAADGIFVGDDHGGDDGLFDFGDVAGIGKFRGAVDFHDFAGDARDAVTHAGRGGDEIQAEFSLQALLHDFHVQQAEEAAAEAETEGDGIFRLVKKRRVVQLQFAERVAQRLVFVGEHRKHAGENHGLDGFESGKCGRGARGVGDGVAHARVGDALDIGDDEADVAGFQFFERDGLGRERAESFDFVDFVAVDQADFRVRRDAAFHHAHENDCAAINIEPGIKNQRLQRIFRAAFGRRDARDDGFQNIFHADAAFRADEQRIGRGNGQHAFDLFFDEIGLRRGQDRFC